MVAQWLLWKMSSSGLTEFCYQQSALKGLFVCVVVVVVVVVVFCLFACFVSFDLLLHCMTKIQ